MSAPAGLLLLTGGRGRRFGGPKHGQPHPGGGSWGGHLVDVFQAVFPGGPVQILGQALPDRPGLGAIQDPGQGPAVALAHWAGLGPEPVLRWWVLACDQVRWTPEALTAWHEEVCALDPGAERWVMAQAGGHTQYLGSFLAGSLVAGLVGSEARSLEWLARALPCALSAWSHACWTDVDTADDLRAWQADPSNWGFGR